MELDEFVKMLEQREERVDALRSRLVAVKKAEEELTREIGAAPNLAPPTPVSRPRNRTATREILERSYEILRAAESHELPMSVGELRSRLESQRVHVGGKKPTGNLSAMLGRDDRFQSEGRGGNGWYLAVPTPDAPPNTQVNPPVA